MFLASRRKYELAVTNLNKMAKINQQPELDEREIDEVYAVIPISAKTMKKKWKIFFDKWHWKLSLKCI